MRKKGFIIFISLLILSVQGIAIGKCKSCVKPAVTDSTKAETDSSGKNLDPFNDQKAYDEKRF